VATLEGSIPITTFAGLIAVGVTCWFQGEYQNANIGAEALVGDVVPGVGVGLAPGEEFETEEEPIAPQPATLIVSADRNKNSGQREETMGHLLRKSAYPQQVCG
jgi:hypothetical protein